VGLRVVGSKEGEKDCFIEGVAVMGLDVGIVTGFTEDIGFAVEVGFEEGNTDGLTDNLAVDLEEGKPPGLEQELEISQVLEAKLQTPEQHSELTAKNILNGIKYKIKEIIYFRIYCTERRNHVMLGTQHPLCIDCNTV